MNQSSPPSIPRRRLFAGAGTATALAAAAVALPLAKQAEPAAESPKPAPEKGGGYQLSAHVKRYYETTKV